MSQLDKTKIDLVSQAITDIIKFSQDDEFRYRCFNYMKVVNCNEIQYKLESELKKLTEKRRLNTVRLQNINSARNVDISRESYHSETCLNQSEQNIENHDDVLLVDDILPVDCELNDETQKECQIDQQSQSLKVDNLFEMNMDITDTNEVRNYWRLNKPDSVMEKPYSNTIFKKRNSEILKSLNNSKENDFVWKKPFLKPSILKIDCLKINQSIKLTEQEQKNDDLSSITNEVQNTDTDECNEIELSYLPLSGCDLQESNSKILDNVFNCKLLNKPTLNEKDSINVSINQQVLSPFNSSRNFKIHDDKIEQQQLSDSSSANLLNGEIRNDKIEQQNVNKCFFENYNQDFVWSDDDEEHIKSMETESENEAINSSHNYTSKFNKLLNSSHSIGELDTMPSNMQPENIRAISTADNYQDILNNTAITSSKELRLSSPARNNCDNNDVNTLNISSTDTDSDCEKTKGNDSFDNITSVNEAEWKESSNRSVSDDLWSEESDRQMKISDQWLDSDFIWSQD